MRSNGFERTAVDLWVSVNGERADRTKETNEPARSLTYRPTDLPTYRPTDQPTNHALPASLGAVSADDQKRLDKKAKREAAKAKV